MHAAAIVGGAVLVLIVLLDVLSTTLTLGRGAGPVTRRLLRWLWRSVLQLRPTTSRSRLLANAGPALLVLTVGIWVLLTWVGWWLVFLGSGSIEKADSGSPAGGWDVAYYAGFAVFTLGVGDVVAGSPGWRVLTNVASFGGLALVTLAITYLLSVISAVVTRRALATQIRALGPTAAEMVLAGWTGRSFSPAFTQYLIGLAAPLATVVQQHFAYPVLHFFRSRSPEESAPVAIAVLDDALLLMLAAVAPAAAPDRAALAPVRHVIDQYIRTVGALSATGSGGAPPPPSMAPLLRAGIPLQPPAALQERLRADTERRARLRRLVHEAAWPWPSS
ncbi:ion channel [Geodermatophilus sp. SYSU D00700]